MIYLNDTSKTIFISGNVPSSKNSKVATSNGVFHSKTVQKYLQYIGVKHYSGTKKTVTEYKKRRNLFKESVGAYFQSSRYPLFLGVHPVRQTKRKADFHNICQIILDLLVAHQFIEDDNMDYVVPTPLLINNQIYTVDKHNPGVFLYYQNKEE